MKEDERTALIYMALKELYPEYFETEDEEIKRSVMSDFHDMVFETGLMQICDTITMMHDLAKKKEASQ